MIIKRKTQLLACMAVGLAIASPAQLAFGQDRWGHDHDFHHHDHDHDHGRAAAGAIAGLIGLAVIGAIAGSSGDHDAPPPPQYDGYGRPYELSQGITCYPAQRACYLRNGDYAAITTHSQFGN